MTDIDSKFTEFHERNPHIFDLFLKFAKQVKESGRKIGAKAIAERIRWEIYFERDKGEKYKVNNNYISRYARLAVETDPELVKVFNFRRLKS